ncbi:MAG: multicopper oxidase domain-containing protein [bacterium]|nr:multicopper oxidase domain-containing protein [bacterium]
MAGLLIVEGDVDDADVVSRRQRADADSDDRDSARRGRALARLERERRRAGLRTGCRRELPRSGPYSTRACRSGTPGTPARRTRHIHQNPAWVTSVKDVSGKELLDAPRWQDVVRLPRGGRVVFRSRFVDYVGEYVDHCHILSHEDNGMMQAVAIVVNPDDANAVPKSPGYQQDPGFTVTPEEAYVASSNVAVRGAAPPAECTALLDRLLAAR